MAKEWGESRRRDSQQLYNSDNHHCRQRLDVQCGGEQHNGDSDQHSGVPHRESSSSGANDYHATGQSGSDGRPDSDLRSRGEWNGAVELSMAKKRCEYHWSNIIKLHHTRDNDR